MITVPALLAGLALVVLVTVVVVQDKSIARLRKKVETLHRANRRERAAAAVARAELEHLAKTAAVVTLWRQRSEVL